MGEARSGGAHRQCWTPDAVPLLHRAAAIPFVKSLDYTHQREYRFTVSTIGKPVQETLLVPTTPELKELATEVN